MQHLALRTLQRRRRHSWHSHRRALRRHTHAHLRGRWGLRLGHRGDRALGLWIHRERLVQHHRLGVVFAIEDTRHTARPVIDVRNQIQHHLGFVRQADFRQIVEEMTGPSGVLILECQHGSATLGIGRLLPECRLVRARPFMDKLPGLLQQQHAGAKP